ncbi:ribonuclease P protein subunit p38 [Discoglossus pictus]
MAAKATKGSKPKQKPMVVKTSLKSPYDINWSPVVGDDMQFILQTIMEKFKEVGLKKVEINKERSKKTKQKKSTDVKSNQSDDEKNIQKKTEVKPGWTNVDLRKELAIGINEVTRALEKNQVNLVLVCKSAKPPMMTKHLIELSASREIPACQVPRLSENIAPVLGLKSIMALGFKTSSDIFQEEVKAVIPRIPPLTVPWLPQETQKDETSEEDVETQEEPSRKRKINQSEANTEKSKTIKLQGLKVKKIVPNPNKIRKVKSKKNVAAKK